MAKPSARASEMFNEMVQSGFITPVEHMEEMRLPGEFMSVPTFISYGISEGMTRNGMTVDAKLGKRS